MDNHVPNAVCGLAFIFAIALIISSCDNTFSHKSLPVVVITGEYPPYVSAVVMRQSSGDGGAYGLAADITSTVLRDMNREPSYQFRQWSIVKSMLKKKKIDVSFPFTTNEERLAYLCFSDPLYSTEPVLLFNIKAYVAAQSADNFKTLKLGTIEGYHDEPALLAYFPSKEINIPSLKIALQRLIDGKIQVLASVKKVSGHVLAKSFASRKQELLRLDRDQFGEQFPRLADSYPQSYELHLVVPRPDGGKRPCSTPFLDLFNEKLAQIKDQDTGIYKEILDRYESSDSKVEEVVLRATDRFPLIYAHQASAEDKDPPATAANLLIPDQTRAAVIHWNPNYQSVQDKSVETSEPLTVRSKVRILEGPVSGNLVWVSNVYISL